MQLNDRLLSVAEEYEHLFFSAHHPPLSASNKEPWESFNWKFKELKPQEQKEVLDWLSSGHFLLARNVEDQARIRDCIWSLSQSVRDYKTIWWGAPLIGAANGPHSDYMYLVEIGDTLQFSNRKHDLKLQKNPMRIAAHLSSIIAWDNKNELRQKALPLEQLMKYTDELGISMYQLRVGQVMTDLLMSFKKKKFQNKKLQIMIDLHLLVGLPPKDAELLATNALSQKDHPAFLKLFKRDGSSPRDHGDYLRISKQLEDLKSRKKP